MRKTIMTLLAAVILIPALFIFTGCGSNGSNIKLISGNYKFESADSFTLKTSSSGAFTSSDKTLAEIIDDYFAELIEKVPAINEKWVIDEPAEKSTQQKWEHITEILNNLGGRDDNQTMIIALNEGEAAGKMSFRKGVDTYIFENILFSFDNLGNILLNSSDTFKNAGDYIKFSYADNVMTVKIDVSGYLKMSDGTDLDGTDRGNIPYLVVGISYKLI